MQHEQDEDRWTGRGGKGEGANGHSHHAVVGVVQPLLSKPASVMALPAPVLKLVAVSAGVAVALDPMVAKPTHPGLAAQATQPRDGENEEIRETKQHHTMTGEGCCVRMP